MWRQKGISHSVSFLTKDVQTLPLETLAGRSGAYRFVMPIGARGGNSRFILFSLNLFPHPDTDSPGWVNFNGMRHFPVNFKHTDNAHSFIPKKMYWLSGSGNVLD